MKILENIFKESLDEVEKEKIYEFMLIHSIDSSGDFDLKTKVHENQKILNFFISTFEFFTNFIKKFGPKNT